MEISKKSNSPRRWVIKDWDVTSVILFVLLFPLSLIYIAFRFLQEWEPSDGDI